MPFHDPRPDQIATSRTARRVALVIGNGRYVDPAEAEGNLRNAVADANAIANVLRKPKLNFDVTLGTELDSNGMARVLGDFEAKLRNAAVALVYYAGHGFEIDGENYLIPVRTEIRAKLAAKSVATSVNALLREISSRDRISIVFLDACRNNPYSRSVTQILLGSEASRGALRGNDGPRSFAPMDKHELSGTFVAFATAPGTFAFDGNQGGNSPFTTALLEHIETPGLSITDMMIDVRNSVGRQTNDLQEPWEQGSLRSRFYFVEKADEPPAALTVSEPSDEWASVQHTNSLAVLAVFRSRYAGTKWSEYAHARIEELRAADEAKRIAADAERAAENISPKKSEFPNKASSYLQSEAVLSDRPDSKPARSEKGLFPVGLGTSEAQNQPWRLLAMAVAGTVLFCLLLLWSSWPSSLISNPSKQSIQRVPPAPVPKEVRSPAPRPDVKLINDAALKPGQTFTDCAICPVMLVIPTGTAPVGAEDGPADEKPVKKVTIDKPFAVAKFEITFEEWDACVADRNGCTHKPDDWGWGRGNRPVIGVSWLDINQEYLPWLKTKTGKQYRFLSESEWEYSARSGSTTKYYYGDNHLELCLYGNVGDMSMIRGRHSGRYVACDDGYEHTAPVGQFRPNAFGLYDMIGNIAEWVGDCEHGDYSNAPRDGSAWMDGGTCDRHMIRGGSYIGLSHGVGSATRYAAPAAERFNTVGFRVARPIGTE